MATPAKKLEQLREQLFDHSVRKHELWLHRVRQELEAAHRRGEVDEPTFHDLMGVIYGHLECYEAAVRHGRAAVALAPDDHLARYNLAVSLQAAGQPEEAIAILEANIDQRLATVEDHTALVAAYGSVGRWKSARKALESAMACADLHNVDHLWRLTIAAAEAGKYERAVALLGRYLAARAGHADADVLSDPLVYVLLSLSENDRLKDVPEVPFAVADAIQRMILRSGAQGSMPAPVTDVTSRDDEVDDEGSRVFRAFAPARSRATTAAMTDDE